MKVNKPCVLLIVVAGMERFAFKGVACNLVNYLTGAMGMSNSSAAKTVNSWVGFTSMLPLLVSALADSYWNRYSTILASSMLYVTGLLALTSTALQWPWKVSSALLLSWSLYMISLGQSGYNPSLQALGADQHEDEDELSCTNDKNNDKQSSGKSLFFQMWYFGVCCGSVLGVSIMSYIQDNLGWGLGFAIPTAVMVMSVAMFLSGSRFYAYKQGCNVDAKSFGDVIQAIRAGLSKIIYGQKGLSKDGYDLVELELQEKTPCIQHSDSIPEPEEDLDDRILPLDAAKVILRLLPVWLMLLAFAIIFQQPPTFFTKQGMTMKRNIGSKFEIPPAALQSAITISIILLMPFYDTLFIPVMRAITRNEKGISVMQRMGIGMFLSVVAMAIAAIVERKRLDISKHMGIIPEPVPYSIFWLLPQYILLGISDIFTVVGMQEFFYSEVPVRMRTIGIALSTSVFGVGSFLSAILISLIDSFSSSGGRHKSWFSNDMNEARLDKYYWFLALLSTASLLTYIVFCIFSRGKTAL